MPNRMIKETIRTSKSVNGLSDFLFRVWLYLITYADDYGRGSADPELLKGLVFPRRRELTEQALGEAMQELSSRGLIVLYEAEGEPYFLFPNWSEHQRIQTKRSKFPEPPQGLTVGHGEKPFKPNQKETELKTESEDEDEAAGVRAREKEDGFDAFWAAYPRKTGNIDRAYREYREALGAGVTPEALLEAITWQAKEWSETQEARYMPSAEKWLHNRGWEAKKGVGKAPKPREPTGAPEYFTEPGTLEKLLENIEKI